MFAQGGRVTGVNTAASIWALAAVGALVGTGYYLAAITTTLLMLCVICLSEFISLKLERTRSRYNNENDQIPP